MKNISTRYPDNCGGGMARRRYVHKGIVIESSNLEWIIWQDYVTQHWCQLRASTLEHARLAINGMA